MSRSQCKRRARARAAGEALAVETGGDSNGLPNLVARGNERPRCRSWAESPRNHKIKLQWQKQQKMYFS